MKTVRTEARNGYEIRLRTIRIHGHRAACTGASWAGGYVAFVQIVREGEVIANWHQPRVCRLRTSREKAEAEALQYAVRLVDRRPFDGPPPDIPEAA
ncbi:hypothetical protein J8I87_28575 [Paraburkholderia sp. LEh10]|uniref:hypothetical protein n=1 Tax=Paraburkholderia sp. LEh10 TaxID=2821353 RepID=UPI001AE8DFEB|nr:hypothetical protein [Paraburkholderia sp. LEh10]MBP0593578.1 hypothetical protein [Paraburkholderia sp. LEh10]